MQIRRHRRRRAHRGDWAPWRHLNGSALKNSSNLFLVSRGRVEAHRRRRRGGAGPRATTALISGETHFCISDLTNHSTYNIYGAACRAARDSRALVQIPARDAIDTTRRS